MTIADKRRPGAWQRLGGAVCCLAALTGSGIHGVCAEDEGNTPRMEEVVVTGIRGSLTNSVNIKRNASAVVDAVSAEDIGKFPDNDVAESLARIPGISVNRQFGQGQQVSVRGASNQLTLTTLNGQNVASTGWYDQQAIDRSFNYTLLPPEMIAGIEVYKSSRADLVEGGVGGTVNVRTRKPLELDAGTAFASAEYDYGTISKQGSPGVSALYNWQNDSRTFGILGAIARQDTTYVRQGTEALYGWNPKSGIGAVSVNAFAQDRVRTALDLAAQYKPSEAMQFGVHYMRLEMDANNTNTSVFLFQDVRRGNCAQFAADGTTCVLATMDSTNPPHPALDKDGKPVLDKKTGKPIFVSTRPYLQTFSRAASMQSDTLDLDFSYQAERYLLTARGGRTEASGGASLTANFGQRIGDPADAYGTFDARGDQVALRLANPGWTVSDILGNVTAPSGWAENSQPNTDRETYAQADIELDVEWWALESIKTGLRWTDHAVTVEDNRAVYGNGIQTSAASNYWRGVTLAGMQGYTIPRPDFNAMQNEARRQITGFVRSRSAYGAIAEKNIAFYVMGNFAADDIYGNVGVRYIHTDAASDFYGADPGHRGQIAQNNNLSRELSTRKASYADVLPSLNIAYDINEEWVARLSAAQVISRPNYADMFSRSSYDGLGDVDPSNQTVNTGNISLKPFKAMQADLALEWYYGAGNLASMTWFIKDVNNFTTFTSRTGQSIGVIDPVCMCDNWTVNTRINGTGGLIKGVELQLQHAFDNGFGGLFNYTYADARADSKNFSDLVGVFSDSSKHTLNMAAYYETEIFSARAAWNWRSEYMIRETGFYGSRMHDDYGTLDLSLNWQMNNNIGVSFNAVNVLEEDSIQRGAAPTRADIKPELKNGYPAWTYKGEAHYILGINVRF